MGRDADDRSGQVQTRRHRVLRRFPSPEPMTPAKKSPRSRAIDGLRDAYLRLEYIFCMNELDEDQEWIADFLGIARRKIGRMLRVLEPKRRPPNVRDDTKLGRSIKEAEADRKRWAK